MNASLSLIAFSGFLAGLMHVLTGPDHLAAIAPLAADQPGKGWKTGLFWGIGHTTSVWVVAILVFLLREILPLEQLSDWGERVVGIVLIGVGIWGIQNAMMSKIDYREHEHGDGLRHSHFFLRPQQTGNHDNKPGQRHSHASFGIGILHGFAGSSHFIAILPALALPGRMGAFVFVLGFGIGTIAAMSGFSWLIGVFMQRFFDGFSKAYKWTEISFASLAIGVGVFWLLSAWP